MGKAPWAGHDKVGKRLTLHYYQEQHQSAVTPQERVRAYTRLTMETMLVLQEEFATASMESEGDKSG